MGESPEGAASLVSVRAACLTDRGKVRDHNEDFALVRDDLGLYLVADGAGGHNAGDVASALAARAVSDHFAETAATAADGPDVDRFGIAAGARRLSAAVQRANSEVVTKSRSSDKHRGMGTTVVAVTFSLRSALVHVAHVGDSRCYRMRGGNLELLTQDHSLLNDVLEQRPELDEKVLARLPKNVITRALGMEEKVRVAVRSWSTVAGDRYLLCSDGLSGMVPAEQIAAALGSDATPDEIVAGLVDMANDAGGVDNIAAVVIECSGGPDAALPASARLSSIPSRPPESSEPEIWILGIEELDLDTATTDFAEALDKLVDKKRR